MRSVLHSEATRIFLNQARPKGGPDRIRSIAMIGAVPLNHYFDDIPPGTPTQMEVRDEHALLLSLQTLDALALPRVRDPDIRLYNLNDGDDFLRGDIKADMVIFCFIFAYRASRFAALNKLASKITYGGHGDRLVRHFYAQSPLSFDNENWHRAVLASGAKAVGNMVQRVMELPNDYIEKPPYTRIGTRKVTLFNAQGQEEAYEIDLLLNREWAPAAALPWKTPKSVPVPA
jgi:hypothetical protein